MLYYEFYYNGLVAEGAHLSVLEAVKASTSIMLNDEIDGSMYGATYPSIYGSENGARNK